MGRVKELILDNNVSDIVNRDNLYKIMVMTTDGNTHEIYVEEIDSIDEEYIQYSGYTTNSEIEQVAYVSFIPVDHIVHITEYYHLP